jgi:uncharacterized membrane protein
MEISAMPAWSDVQIERFLGALLRTGVMTAAVIVILGGTLYLRHHGAETPAYRTFHGEPPDLCSVPGIVSAARELQARAIIQFGLLVLIATPIARVFFSILAFAAERDFTYALITALVLMVLVYSFAGGQL